MEQILDEEYHKKDLHIYFILFLFLKALAYVLYILYML